MVKLKFHLGETTETNKALGKPLYPVLEKNNKAA